MITLIHIFPHLTSLPPLRWTLTPPLLFDILVVAGVVVVVVVVFLVFLVSLAGLGALPS